MIGDILIINGRREVVISEQLITVYPDETEAQRRAREKAHKPAPMYQYTAVKTRLERKR